VKIGIIHFIFLDQNWVKKVFANTGLQSGEQMAATVEITRQINKEWDYYT